MADNEYFDEVTHLWDEEGFFARDMSGQLIRVVEATAKDYDEIVTVTIDGQEVRVPRAVPSTDAQGNFINDADGRTVPRKTTILDAAVALFRRDNPAASLPIPTLCHAEHLKPVGVCRVCSVEVGRMEPDRREPGKMREVASGKLVPACVQPVEPGMIVYTLESRSNEKAAGRVQNAVKVLLEMLASDHLPRPAGLINSDDLATSSDLERLVDRLGPTLGLDPVRFAGHQGKALDYPRDDSSPLIAIDHNACILCERCIRSCNDVKQNLVIGRSGKGYTTRIGFDLNDPIGESSCVSCGECMLSCPTNALTFREPVTSQWWQESVRRPGYSAVTAAELEHHPLLGVLSYRFRQWNESSIIRRRVKAGDELCRLGDYGSTAFILNSGRFGIYAADPRVGTQRVGDGWLTRIKSLLGGADSGASLTTALGQPTDISTAEDVILGEMTCLSHFPRTATIIALSDGEIFEVRRNVLFALQRNPMAREVLDRVYRQRALRAQLDAVSFFGDLTNEERDQCRSFLRDKVQLVRVDPGQVIFRLGESADAFYMVRQGYVKFTQTAGGREQVLNYLGPNKHFGEIGLVAELPKLAALIPESLRNRRTATCMALDDVELVRIIKSAFQEMLRRFPKLQQRFAAIAQGLLARQSPTGPARTVSDEHLQRFTEQGLFNGQKLLVLDLEACTRCDECSKACADTHQGVTRLIRDGLRFDKWLVASACRSCSDPYCLVGCPVDAIHRDGERKEITIESHCIGCGLCANNCPYGNINMHGQEELRPDPAQPKRLMAVVQQRATTCDLCHHVVGPHDQVSCVFACPHNAAFRMSGEELLAKVSPR